MVPREDPKEVLTEAAEGRFGPSGNQVRRNDGRADWITKVAFESNIGPRGRTSAEAALRGDE
jgi:hypothetical protein